jgi:predicted DNA-binding transcriptional regulator AlpA
MAERRLPGAERLEVLLNAPERALDLPPAEAAAMLAQAEGLAAVLRARLAGAGQTGGRSDTTGPDEMLKAEQAARRTGMSERLLYKKAKAGELPFACRVSEGCVRFSARGIERWLAQKGRG